MNIKDLFTITCLAQFLSEHEDYQKDKSLAIDDLSKHIEEAAILFFIAHSSTNVDLLAENAVKDIRKIWEENDGYWPDEYRF